MDNMYQPEGDPQDLDQTQQLPPMGGQGFPGRGGSEPPAPRHHGRPLRWGAGIALAALLFGGGAVAASDLTSSSAPALASNASSAGTAGPTGQAARLNAILSSATSPSAASSASAFASAAPGKARTGPGIRCLRVRARLRATGHPRAAHAVARACRRVGRIRLLGGMYGQFTFRAKSGVRTIAYERGTVQSDSGSSVVVRAADGTTETWSLTSKTVVRQNRSRTTGSALSAGQQVFVAGPVISGAHDIRLAVIRPATAGSASGNPASGS